MPIQRSCSCPPYRNHKDDCAGPPFAKCHPDRRLHAKGMCAKCYHANLRKKHRKSANARSLRWQKANPEKYRATQRRAWLKKNWNMTEEEYGLLLAESDGMCAICGREPTRGRSLHVDHDHQSGVIRGLLCRHCNLGLGNFLDRADLLKKAIKYLARSGSDA